MTDKLPPRLRDAIAAVEPVDRTLRERVMQRFDRKTKPVGSLGRLEWLGAHLCAIARDDSRRELDKAIVVMAADHGVAEEGVSAYPQEVTAQMVDNFARGGAAINVLAQRVGARLIVADLGVRGVRTPPPAVRDLRVDDGTANLARGPAMREDQAATALQHGIALAHELADAGVAAIGLGEMGIANTTSATAILAGLTGLSPRGITGRGTGIDNQALERKIAIIESALSLHGLPGRGPFEVLCRVGGFEVAGLAGVCLGAAARRVAVLIDGFISGAAALVACRLCPLLCDYLIASHRSVEPGHAHMLRALETEPLLDMELRLGEGTGAALAMPLLDAALSLLQDMATFESAGVSGAHGG